MPNLQISTYLQCLFRIFINVALLALCSINLCPMNLQAEASRYLLCKNKAILFYTCTKGDFLENITILS